MLAFGTRWTEPGELPRFQAALDLVLRDLARTWPDGPALRLLFLEDEGWGARLQVALSEERYHGAGIPLGDYEPDVSVVELVADAAQETILAVLWRTWPTCGTHQLGLHVSTGFMASEGPRWTDSDEPAWWCSGGGRHVVGAIGQLP